MKVIEEIYKTTRRDNDWSYPLSVTQSYVQQLIRCKDCKHHGNIDPNYCVELERNTNNDFFCGFGVKCDE